MSEAQENRVAPTDERLTARDGAVGASHAAQLAHIGGPLAHTAVQAVGLADAAKVAIDVAQGKEVRAIDVASAAASVTMTAGIGGPALQVAAQGVAFASGMDAASRGVNTLQDAYDKAVAAPIAADVSDRKDIEARQSPGALEKKSVEERARADVSDLHGIDHQGERTKAISAMVRTASRDSEYNEAVRRLDPLAAESVTLAAQEGKATKERGSPGLAAEANAESSARDWVARNLTALKTIESDVDRRHALVEMGNAVKEQPLYKVELLRQDPTAATAVGLANESDQRRQSDKEDHKAEDMRARGAADRGAEDRLEKSLDDRMAKSELEERGWKGRDDLADVMADLQKLASQDWQRAADLWEKYRPGDADKPNFLEGEEAQLPRQSPAKADNAVDRDQKEADRGQQEPKETEFLTPESIRKRFIQAENKYFYREDENRLAFEDKGKRLATAHNDPEVARSMVELAEAKGWDALKIKGTETFKRTVWLQASLRGMEVDGFEPKDVDLAKLKELQSEQSKTSSRRPAPAQARAQVQNVVEQTTARQHTQPEQAIDRTAVVDEHQQTLSKQQRQAVEALKAILRDRGDSEQAVNMAADVAAARFQNNRVHVGKILAHGQAPYEHNQANASNYYVKLQTERSEKEIWGVDLRRALGEGGAKVGDDVALSYQGRQKVTVPVKERDAQGKVIGHTEIAVDRNTWDVNRLENVRDEVREALQAAANKTETRQPLMKVYDRAAPREELRPEPAREHARRNERTR